MIKICVSFTLYGFENWIYMSGTISFNNLNKFLFSNSISIKFFNKFPFKEDFY